MIFDSFGCTAQVLCRISLSWGMFDIFLIIRFCLWVLGRKITEVKCYSYHILLQVQTINMTSLMMFTLITWLRESCSTFSLVKVLFTYCAVWKKVTMSSSHLRDGELCFISLKGQYLHKIFGILLCGRFISSCPFIYLFNHSFISVVNTWIFHILGYNTVLLYWICSNFWCWPLGALYTGSFVHLTHP